MATGSSRSFKINLFVSNHVGSGNIDAKFIGGFQYQARCGLSAAASLIWAMRAVVDSIQLASHLGKLLAEFCVYLRHLLVSSQSAANGGLISYNDYTESSPPYLPEGFLDSGKNLELFRSFDIVRFLSGQDAVSIKKDRPVHGQC